MSETEKKKTEEGKVGGTEKKNAEEKQLEKYAKGELTLREAAEGNKKDLQTFMDILSRRGLALPEERVAELQGFERRQYDYIIHKIAEAIRERAGQSAVIAVYGELLKGKLTVQKAAQELGLKLGDFAIILEADGLLKKKEIAAQLK